MHIDTGAVPAVSVARRAEAGFTLVELLVVIAIMGIISVGFTEAIFVSLRTTSRTGTSISDSVALSALTTYFTEDVHSAQYAATTRCAPTPDGVLLDLSWTGATAAQSVTYALDRTGSPATTTTAGPGATTTVAPGGELVRWSCTQGSAPARVLLGQTSDAVTISPACASAVPPCQPRTVTLEVRAPDGSQPFLLTVSPRSAP